MSILRANETYLELAREAIAEVHQRSLDDAALADFLSRPWCYLLLACEDGHVVGSLNGYALQHPHRSQPQFILYEIDVRPEWRNRGIGKALVENFITEAQASSAFEVWVLTNQSNEAAIALYKSCGLHRHNDDDVMLSLTL